MSNISAEDLNSRMVCVIVTNLDSDERYEVKTKERNRCHFIGEKLRIGKFDVQLRLDWSDLDQGGNPCLDADFFANSAGKLVESMKRDPAHHTRATGADRRIYEWKYQNKVLNILVEVTWSVEIKEVASAHENSNATICRYGAVTKSAAATESCDAELVRAPTAPSSK